MDWIKCIASRLRRAGRRQAGVTLIETVMAITLFGIVSTSMITMLTSATAADGLAREKSIALELAQQQVEYIRQLGYVNAGTASGNPAGIVEPTQSKRVMGLWYTLSTEIKWVNDPLPSGFVTHANYKRILVIVSRTSDDKELSRVATYLSSSTRDPLGGLNNAIINVQAKDYVTNDLLGGVTIDLTRPPSSFSASDTTDNVTGSPTFGQVTFPALAATGSTEYYEIRASQDGYETLNEDLPENDSLHATSSIKLDPSDTKSPTLRLYKPCSITVRIIDQSTGLTYNTGSATVTISSPRGSQAFTTTNGYVSLSTADTLAGEPIVPGSNYSITVDTPTHRHGELTSQTVPFNYQAGNLNSSFEVTLGTEIIPQTATLTVNVRRIRHSYDHCEDSTEYIQNADVTINDPGQSPPYSGHIPYTNANGQAIFSDIPLGTYDIYAHKWISGADRPKGLADQPLTDNLSVCIPLMWWDH